MREPNTKRLTIKRVSQFLFDNAGRIVRQLSVSSNYRSVTIQLDMFKHDKPELHVSLSFYDEKTTHYYLYDDAICIERFEQICKQLNSESGVTPLPKPVKVRKTLNTERKAK